jgi:hypothetical protein
MMPRLGQKYAIEIETSSKPIAEYQTDEYFELDLPTAPAVMVGEEIVVESADVAEAGFSGSPLGQVTCFPGSLANCESQARRSAGKASKLR